MHKMIYFGALLLLTFASANAGERKASDRAQVVIRAAEDGTWKMFVFGPHCANPAGLKVSQQTDPAEPVEITCSK